MTDAVQVPGTSPAAAPPPAAPAPVGKPAEPSTTVTRKSYATSPKRAAAPPPAPTITPATAQPALEASPAGPVASATSGAGSAVAAHDQSASPAADGKPAEPGDPAAAPAADPSKPVLEEGEVAKRLATISRAERRLQEQQRSHSDKLAVADAVAQVLGPGNATPQVVSQVLRQAAMVSQGRQAAHQDPIGFLQRVFGVDPRHVYQRAIDGAIAEGAKPPEARAKDDVRSIVQEAIKPYEEQLRAADERTKAEQTQRQAEDYQRTTLAPLVQAPEFAGIRQYCAVTGSDPTRELYNAMVSRFQATGRAPDPKALAQELEQIVQSRLTQAGFKPAAPPSGTSAASAGQAPKRVETPTAPPEVSRRTAADPSLRAPATVRPRLNGKPYTTKPL